MKKIHILIKKFFFFDGGRNSMIIVGLGTSQPLNDFGTEITVSIGLT